WRKRFQGLFDAKRHRGIADQQLRRLWEEHLDRRWLEHLDPAERVGQRWDFSTSAHSSLTNLHASEADVRAEFGLETLVVDARTVLPLSTEVDGLAPPPIRPDLAIGPAGTLPNDIPRPHAGDVDGKINSGDLALADVQQAVRQ